MKQDCPVSMFPCEIWYMVFNYLHIHDLSKLACSCKCFNQLIYDDLYDIIDGINWDFTVPESQETFKKYRYVIDFQTLQNNKCYFSDKVIELFNEHIDLNYYSTHQALSENIIKQFWRRIDLNNLLKNQVIAIDILENITQEYYSFLDNSHWYTICSNQPITLDYIKKYINHIDWYAVSQNKQTITTELFNSYYSKLFWPELTKLGVSEYILRQFEHKLDVFAWQNVAYTSKLSTEFITEYWEKLKSSVLILVSCQEIDELLLEFFILTTNDVVQRQDLWNKIANCQALSEQFIRKHKSELPFRFLIRNNKIKRKVLQNIYG